MSEKQSPSAETTPTEETTTPTTPPIPIVNGCAVCYGYGFRCAVERNHLILADGLGADRRDVRLHKATSPLHHLCILAHSGSLTIGALRWLGEAGVSVAFLDADSRVTFTLAPPGTDVPKLRRAQVWAAEDRVGVEIVRMLLERKVRGQAAVVRLHLGKDDVADYLDAAADTMGGLGQLDELRALEGRAAWRYWECWESVRVGFSRRDRAKVPDHWLTAGPRLRPTGRPQDAISPAHALLNLTYALLESQVTIGLVAIGADAGLGFLHTDERNRASLTLDVMEALRPRADELVLDLLAGRTFAKGDFWQRQNGDIRLMSSLARELCGYLIPILREWAGPLVEEVVGMILRGYDPTAPHRTPLSHENRRVAWRKRKGIAPPDPSSLDKGGEPPRPTGISTHPTPDGTIDSRPAPRPRPPTRVPRTCPECGKPIPDGSRSKFCSEACARAARPAHGGEVGRKRGASNARRGTERVAWERAHPDLDREAARARYRAEVAPRLAGIPLARIMAATGLSSQYASLVRRGEIPHPRFFEALEHLVEESARNGNE